MLIEIYKKLLYFFGAQYWWPAQTQDEIIIGAVLTQNTAWSNVEKAIEALKSKGLCTLESLRNTDIQIIQQLIRPAYFYKQKSVYLKSVAEFFEGFDSNIDTAVFRKKILEVKGVGYETADSILLYAFSRPIFVVDAYTKRLIERQKMFFSNEYHEIQQFFMKNLPNDVDLFKEYHALIVQLCKTYCKKQPNCSKCPLKCA